jgi:hypothetical protein
MNNPALEEAIKDLAALSADMPQTDLERPWQWGSYDEGIRFAFFRITEELRDLAVRVRQARMEAGRPLSQAQAILGDYHAAYLDLNAAVLGLDEAGLNTPPAEGEWPVRRAIAHILNADLGFYVVASYALARHRSADGRPERISESVWEPMIGMNDAQETALYESSAADLLAYFDGHHRKVVDEFSAITDGELELASYYWEEEPYPLRFRLHRFASHLRQHTIQIDKTIAAIQRLPGEPVRLMRMVEAALADAETARLGAGDCGADLAARSAEHIAGWIRQIR